MKLVCPLSVNFEILNLTSQNKTKKSAEKFQFCEIIVTANFILKNLTGISKTYVNIEGIKLFKVTSEMPDKAWSVF